MDDTGTADDVTQGFVQRPDIDWVTNDPTTQLAGTTRATQSPVIAVPAWATTCQLALAYQVAAAGDDEFSWSFIADGAEILRRTEEDTMGGQPLIFVDVPLQASQAPAR